jgi:hypothetical protein
LGLSARLMLRRDTLHVLSAICLFVHVVYVVYIGGDHFEFRVFDFYWPLLAIAAVDGMLVLANLVERRAERTDPSYAGSIGSYAYATLFAVVIAYSTVLPIAHHCLTYDLRTRGETFGMHTPIAEKEYPAAFLLPFMEKLILIYNHAMDKSISQFVGTRWLEHRVFYEDQNRDWYDYCGRTEGLIPPDAVASYVSVGLPAYCLAELTAIDLCGLTDRVIAHHGEPSNRNRKMAHDRSAPEGYIESRHVNITVYPSTQSLSDALIRAQWALHLKDNFWMPFDSPDENWVRRSFPRHLLYNR